MSGTVSIDRIKQIKEKIIQKCEELNKKIQKKIDTNSQVTIIHSLGFSPVLR
jgi:hypothetical protein